MRNIKMTLRIILKDTVDVWLFAILVFLLIRGYVIDANLFGTTAFLGIIYFGAIYRKSWWQNQANMHITDPQVRQELKLETPTNKPKKRGWMWWGTYTIVCLILITDLLQEFVF